MDRRSFLQVLAAIGLAPVVPPVLRHPAEIQAAWDRLVEAPATFNVTDGGAILIPGFKDPTTRGECLGVDTCGMPVDAEGLIRFVRDNPWAEDPVAHAFEDACPELPGGWQAWVRQSPEQARACAEAIEAWVADTNLDEYDTDAAEGSGNTARSAAFHFWEDAPEAFDLFPVVLVEGDRPGSNYIAAELTCPVAEANRLAIQAGLPVRFRAV
jgi:hypothetical protein